MAAAKKKHPVWCILRSLEFGGARKNYRKWRENQMSRFYALVLILIVSGALNLKAQSNPFSAIIDGCII
jgi:hypothetical protein